MKLHKEHTPLPGTERYTQPSEIKALSKFLGHIKEVQEEHTNLEKDNLAVPGNDINLDLSDPRFPENITSLPGLYIPVDGSPIEPELIGTAERLKVTADIPELVNYREEIKDFPTPGLEDGVITIKDSSPEPSLEDTVLNLSTDGNLALELETERQDISSSDINLELEEEKENLPKSLSGGDNISSLPKDNADSIPGKTEKVSSLVSSKSVEKIKKPTDIPLENEVTKIVKPKDINLVDTSVETPGSIPEVSLSEGKESLRDTKEISSLESGVEEIDVPTLISLEDEVEEISVNKNISLENSSDKLPGRVRDPKLDTTLETISEKQINSLERGKETISPRNTDRLETHKETISEKEIFSLEDSKETIYPGSQILDLESTKEEIDVSQDIRLEEGKETLRKDSEISSLVDKSESLEVDNKISTLPGGSIEINSPEDITSLPSDSLSISPKDLEGLSKDRVELGGERKEPDLETASISLENSLEEIGLEDYIENLDDFREQNLDDTRLDLFLEDLIDDLPEDSILRPGKDVEILNLPSDEEGAISGLPINLPEGQEGHLIDGPESLVDYRENIEKSGDQELSDTRLDITSSEEYPLVDYRESLETEGKRNVLPEEVYQESSKTGDIEDFNLRIEEGRTGSGNLSPEEIYQGSQKTLDKYNFNLRIDEEQTGDGNKSPEDAYLGSQKKDDKTYFNLRVSEEKTGNSNISPDSGLVSESILRPDSAPEAERTNFGNWWSKLSDEEKKEWSSKHPNVKLEDGKVLRPGEGFRTIVEGIEDKEFWRKRNVTNEEPLETPEDFRDYLKDKKDFEIPNTEEYYKITEEYLSKDSRVRINRPSIAEDGDRTTTSTAKGFNVYKSKHPEIDDTETIVNLDDFSEESGELRKKILRPSEGDRTTTSLERDGRNEEPLNTPEGFKEYIKKEKKNKSSNQIIYREGKVIAPKIAEDGDRTTTSTAKGFNVYKSKHPEIDDTETIVNLDDFSEESGELRKKILRPSEGDRTTTSLERDGRNEEPLNTPEGFKEYIKKEKKNKSSNQIIYREGKVIAPKIAEDGDRTTTSTAEGFSSWWNKLSDKEKEEWNKTHTPQKLSDGKVLRPGEGFRTIVEGIEDKEFWRKRNVTNEEPLETPEDFRDYLKDKKDFEIPRGEEYYEITEEYLSKDSRVQVNLPQYERPKIGWGNVWSGDALNPGTYLRWAAENTVGTLPLRGSSKQKLINETLQLLVYGREALEKAAKSNRDRLPGNDLDIISDLTRGTNIKGAVTKGMKSIINAIKTVNREDPINRPKKEKIKAKSINKEGKEEEKTVKEFHQKKWKAPGQVFLDSYSDESGKTRDFRDYTSSVFKLGEGEEEFGIGVTIRDLISKNKEGQCDDLESFREALRSSRFITTPEKFTSTRNSTNYMTLDSNHVWEIFFRPYVGEMNGNRTWLPSFLEIDYQNKKAFNYTTYYSRGWLPITGFELQEKKLTSKDLPLFDGAISYPVSMEFTNELRITFADDSLKSLKRYFDLCAKVSAYMSNIHFPHDIFEEIEVLNNPEIELLKDKMTSEEYSNLVKNTGYHKQKIFVRKEDTIYETPIDQVKEITNPTVYLEGKIHPGLYKNLSFLVSIYVLTPQYATVKKCNLLCVLKDFNLEHQGEIDSSPTELSVTFSIVGENPIDLEGSSLGNIANYTPPKKTSYKEEFDTGLVTSFVSSIVSVI